MAYIFKVDVSGNILPLDSGTVGVINCADGAETAFANFYSNEAFTFNAATATSSGDPSFLSPDLACANSSNSRSAQLNRTSGSVNPTIVSVPSTVDFSNVTDTQYTKYGLDHQGNGGAKAKDSSALQFFEIAYPISGNTELFSPLANFKSAVIAGDLGFVLHSDHIATPPDYTGKIDVFAVERFTGSSGSYYYYRIWVVSSAFDNRSNYPDNNSTRITFIEGSGNNVVGTELTGILYGNKQDAAHLTNGASIKSFHMFQSDHHENVPGTSSLIVPLVHDSPDSSEPEFMAIYHGSHGSGNLADEFAPIKAVYRENGAVATCRLSATRWSSNEYMVRTEHTLSSGGYSGNNIGWGLASEFVLTQKQTYGWMSTPNVPPAQSVVAPTVTNGGPNGCGGTINITSLGSYSSLRVQLYKENGASDILVREITNITSTGVQTPTVDVSSISGDPNGLYYIKVVEESTPSNVFHTTSNFTINSCPYASIVSVATNSCGINLVVNSGYTGTLTASVMEGSSAVASGIAVSHRDGSTVNSLSLSGVACGGTYTVRVLDGSGNVLATSSNVTVFSAVCATFTGATPTVDSSNRINVAITASSCYAELLAEEVETGAELTFTPSGSGGAAAAQAFPASTEAGTYTIQWKTTSSSGGNHSPGSIVATQTVVVPSFCTGSNVLLRFRVFDGVIQTNGTSYGVRGLERCDGGTNVNFNAGNYCDVALAAVQSSSSAPFNLAANVCQALTAESITIYLKGNPSGTLQALDSGGNAVANGWYGFCANSSLTLPAAGGSACSNEYFIYISSAAGNWDGKLYDCSGSTSASVNSTDWFDESKLLNYTVKADANPWSGAAPPSAPPTAACGVCSSDVSNKGTLYVSGNLKNATQESEELKVYSSAGEQNPLGIGWYRSCSNTLPVVNGVPAERPKFDCYGNPFVWYSLKNSGTVVTDDNSYLTNGDRPWFNDAPLKDLTTTGCDLGVTSGSKGWHLVGDTKGDTILKGSYTSANNSSIMSCNGVTGGVLDFDPTKKLHLSRALDSYYPTPETGQKIISSAKAGATEMTIALLVNCEANGTIFKLSDVSTRLGAGVYDKLAALSATLCTLELERTSSNYILKTTNTDFSSPQTHSLTVSQSGGYNLIVITASTSGHTIRIDGAQIGTDTTASKFCAAAGGITNFNVELGVDKDSSTSSYADMNFAEMIIYDEELNLTEIEELEGYLSHKWCHLLASGHTFRATGPDCGTCDDECCESDIAVQGVAHAMGSGTDSWKITCKYKASRNVFGYQFKLSGLADLNMTNGFYASGETIPTSVSGKQFQLTFDDPLSKSFLNYIEVTSSGVWVFGHFNEHSTSYGGFDFVLPVTTSSTEFLNVYIKETSSSASQNWNATGLVNKTKIITSDTGFNHPDGIHPLLVTYDPETELKINSAYTGDENANGQVSRVDTLAIIKRISKSHDDGVYDLSGASWLESIDSYGRGWLDISDAVTCHLNIILLAGTHKGSPANHFKTGTVVTAISEPICSEKLIPTKCLPCPCPETEEEDDCVSKAWISDISPLDKMNHFAVVTVKYQSSCCVDGYKLVLGGYNDKIVSNPHAGPYHDGAVFVPSYGNSIGQLTDNSETHHAGWLHGLTLDPTYKGEKATLNISEILSINGNSLIGSYNYLQQKTYKNKLNFPIVWGMSLGQNPAIPYTAESKVERANALESGRMGINCIPATCKGESRVLTKFVINLRSFQNEIAYIKEFRLVTNDKAVTPCSFDSNPSACSNITWTGDSDSNGNISGSDFAACLVYMYAGWGPSTTWDNASYNSIMPPALRKFDSEFDTSYVDIVDSLTVINHMTSAGGGATTNKQLPIVPQDCCPCDVPGSFTASHTINPCDCTEEGYIEGQEGLVTVSWSASSNADGYTIYRVIEDASEASPKFSTFGTEQPEIGALVTLGLKNEIDSKASDSGISDFSLVKAYKDKVSAGKDSQSPKKWTILGRVGSSITSIKDKNPVKFENCCPDDKLPKVKYIVVAFNDCGEKSANTSYYPECCGHTPVANDVNLGTLTVNSIASMAASAYHPYALNPYGGFDVKSTASITVTGIPANGATIKLIGHDHSVKTYIISTSVNSNSVSGDATTIGINGLGTARLVADKIAAGITTSGIITPIVSTVSGNGKIALEQKVATICGNTKITITGDSGSVYTADAKFTGGNKQCDSTVDDYPSSCERLAFFITSISYSAPRSSNGLFIGPSGGGELPSGNLTGLWTWKPPVDYIGTATLTYVVINESGCSDTGTITVNYAPPKLILDCESPPCNSDDYGKVFIKLSLPETGNASKFTVLRKLTSDGAEWDVGTHSIKDDDNNTIVFDLVDYPDEVFSFVDDTLTIPDECCSASLSYDYIVYYCETTAPLEGASYEGLTISGDAVYSCTYSTVCTVVIPCCPKPHNAIPSTSVTQNCASSRQATVKLIWNGIAESDDPYLYIVYRRVSGTLTWQEIAEIDGTPEGKIAANPNWDVGNTRYEYNDTVLTSSYCEASVTYDYAVVVLDKNNKASGNPADENWGDGTDGDPCSPGGVTVTAVVNACPPDLCVEDMDISICLDDDFEYDLSRFVDCVPVDRSSRNPVAVSYAITSSASWVTPVLNGSTLTFDTRGGGTVGTHTDAIVITVSVGAPCADSDTLNINITLIDCNCPCPDDESDYTICDNSFDNEEYVEASKLTGTEQIPFSLTTEGGQTLRKGQPYVVSRGKIDCD